MTDARAIEERARVCREAFHAVEQEISKLVVGQQHVIEHALLCLFSRGHLLLEGVPGVGKTLLVKTISQALNLRFSRVQCTPDLMPADVVGTNVLVEDDRGRKVLRFQPGPLFSDIVLADEINRATPKTQSAFLEAMQERQITALGDTHHLDEPFMVMATQNPIEMEGTYPLPEAQLDRFFFKLHLAAPDLDELSRIVDLTTGESNPTIEPVCDAATVTEIGSMARSIKISGEVKDVVLRLVEASHPHAEGAPETVRRYVRYGASPRAAQSMILAGKARALSAGRYNVAREDIDSVAVAAMRHRLILNFDGEIAGVTTDEVVNDLLRHATG